MRNRTLELIYEGMLNGRIVVYHASESRFDKFDLSYSKSATDKSRHGKGVYFLDDYDATMKYIEMYTRGEKGFIYTCSLQYMDTYINWDEMASDGLYVAMANNLIDNDYDDGRQMLDELESYGETYSNGSLYEILESTIGADLTNEWFLDEGVYGFIGRNIMSPDSVEYCCLDSNTIKILDVEAV